MSTEKTQHGTTTGLGIIVAAAAAFAAIVGASAVVAKKPAPRENFLSRLPKEQPRTPPPPVATDEEDALEEEPRPAELIARAEKLIAGGSANRGQIEGLLLAAIKARPGDDDSIGAFKLLRGLHGKWREEDARRRPSTERPELPPPPPPAPMPAAPPPVAPALGTAGFVSLIGADLSNWGRPSGGTWKIEGGGILADSMNLSGYLYTRKRFRDFTLKLKVTPLATSETYPHLRIRFRWIPEKGKYGCQTDLASKAYFIAEMQETRSAEQVFDIPQEVSLRVGASVELELVAIGENVSLLVEGRQAFSETAKVTEAGQIALCAHRSSILFERVEIKEH